MKIRDKVNPNAGNMPKKIVSTSDRLQEILLKRGIKQADLARSTGISRGAISNYCIGRYEPKSDIIQKLSNALNCSEMWLWGYDVPMEKPSNSFDEIDNPYELDIRDRFETLSTIDQIYARDWFNRFADNPEQIKEAPPASGASEDDDLVRLSEDAQDRLYKIFSAALEANNITGGFAVSRTGVDSTILTRMQNKRLSMANRSELMQLARFLEVQAEAEPLIQGLPALEETLADIYRQLHDQIYQIDPDDIGTVSEVLQVWIKSRKRQ